MASIIRCLASGNVLTTAASSAAVIFGFSVIGSFSKMRPLPSSNHSIFTPCFSVNQRHESDPDGTRRRGLVNWRTLERYEELLRCHVTPVLGKRALQKLNGTEIDDLYVALEAKLAPRTVHHIHTVFGACMKAAVRKGLVKSNPR